MSIRRSGHIRISITELMLGKGSKPAGVTWNYDRAELLTDGMVHVTGLCLALIGIIALTVITCKTERSVEVVSIVVYATSLLAMLGFSAAYNLWPLSPRKWLLRRFDQSAIFVFIAATYTPFIVQMKSDMASLALLAGVWTIAAVGVLMKVLAPGRYERASIALYLLLGWSGVIVYEPLFTALASSTVALLVAGGLLYSGGVVFHVWGTLRFQNAIWHIFVLTAAACHYAAILDCVSFARA